MYTLPEFLLNFETQILEWIALCKAGVPLCGQVWLF
jgi:hypothetical protein